MEERSLRNLEFHKVLSALAGHAASEAGRERCLNLSPASDPEEGVRLGRLTAEGLEFAAETRFSLGEVPDLAGILHFLRSPKAVLDLDALSALRETLGAAREARSAVSAEEGRYPLLADLALSFDFPETLASGLKRTLDADGRLKDESSPELHSVRTEIRSVNKQCTTKVKEFLQQEGLSAYLQDDYMTVSSDRYVVPIKTSYKGKLKGIIHDYSQTGETCYFEPFFLVDMNNRLQELRQEEREEELKVLRLLTGYARDGLEALEATREFLAELDLLLAKAGLARDLDARVLIPEEGARIRLLEARHPLLALTPQGAKPMELDFREGDRALLISGGNAGGKTVCLKTLGLTAAMVLAGLPVPVAAGSSLPALRRVFAFLGDEQSLEESLSTFTAQIRALAQAWDQVDDGTLVVLDEFGAGTDPAQGAALAQGAVEALMERGALVSAATHFPALKAFAMSTPGVRAASVLFDPDTHKPLFRLAYDQVGASIALDVAREHGLPEEILRRAEENLLLDGGGDTGRLLARLNEAASKREEELDAAKREREKLEKKHAGLEERFAVEREKLLEEVRGAARDIVKQWKQGRLDRKEAQRKLARERERLAEAEGAHPRESPPPADLAIGDEIRYLPWDKVGEVVEKNPKKGQVKVNLGGVSLWVKLAEVQPSAPHSGTEAQSKPSSSTQSVRVESGGGGSLVLDVRGYRADEALREVHRFLDQALLAGRSQAEIIHGKGSGALKRKIHEALRSFPRVAYFSLAPEDQGGDGKTLVDFA
ncbi:endonuclease MutS2 [Desulfohalovibrio reitneri]|uniref:endonuclease MutS2 n=1 Tax=Desulfohalovibrio reitneri TaxID=1307759 RepID=UPI0004A7321D|nr:Smr/MutS family protein [Desulfohalovibrio reitneri]